MNAPTAVGAVLCLGAALACGSAEGNEVPRGTETGAGVDHAAASAGSARAAEALILRAERPADPDLGPLEVFSQVGMTELSMAFDGVSYLSTTTRSSTGTARSVQRLLSDPGGALVEEEMRSFQGEWSQMTNDGSPAQSGRLGEQFEGRTLSYRLDEAGAAAGPRDADGQPVGPGEFVHPFAFSTAWLPEVGRAVAEGETWTRALAPADLRAFVRHTDAGLGGEVSAVVENVYTDDGDLYAAIYFDAMVSLTRVSRQGNQYEPMTVLVSGRVDHNVTRGYTARGAFRYTEPLELRGGPQRPSFSMDGWADWRTCFRAVPARSQE